MPVIETMIHGSPHDRGGADSYYRRTPQPHWWPEGSYRGDRVEEKDMSALQVKRYHQGYEENEREGNHKDWG